MGLRPNETMWLKLGEIRRSSIRSQFTQIDSALNVDEKRSKNHGDMMHPYRIIGLQSSKKCRQKHFHELHTAIARGGGGTSVCSHTGTCRLSGSTF